MMAGNFVAFDTETTGLPARSAFKTPVNADNYGAWDSCRIVQIAWDVRTRDNVLVKRSMYYIKPSGFTIPEEAIAIHGITNHTVHERGQSFATVARQMLRDITENEVDVIVAHNMSFDESALLAEMHREGMHECIEVWHGLRKRCTMRMGAKVVPKGRWCKLAVLHEKLFGELKLDEGEKLHDAATDTKLCADVYHFLCGMSRNDK
jgi:DNA polymerase III epsilon subunit-like protein